MSVQPLVIFENSPQEIESIEFVLQLHGFKHYQSFSELPKLISFISTTEPCSILISPSVSEEKDQAVIDSIKKLCPITPIILLLLPQQTSAMIAFLRQGITNYIEKPLDPLRLLSACSQGKELFELRKENQLIVRQDQALAKRGLDPIFQNFITCDPNILEELKFAQAISKKQIPLLISGESGVGKKKLAQLIHSYNPENKELLEIDCAGRKSSLDWQQSELSTLVLTGIENLPMTKQKALYQKITTDKSYPRVIALTEVDLKMKSQSGRFLRALYLLLKGQEIEISPLRDRPKDIKKIALHFTAELGKKQNNPRLRLPNSFDLYTENYAFPGNVAELKNLIDHANQFSKGNYLPLKPIKDCLKRKVAPDKSLHKKLTLSTLNLETSKYEMAFEAMARAGRNQAAAARLLGITRQALNQYIHTLDARLKQKITGKK